MTDLAPEDPLPPAAIPPPLPLAYASPYALAYRSAAPLARILVRWIWVTVFAQVVLLWPSVIGLLNRIAHARGAPGDDELQMGIKIAEGISRALALASIVVLVYWMLWVHRTYRNLPALGALGLRFTPGWAVAYYFIPLVHLYRPFQVMHETWRASDERHAGGESWKSLPKPAIVNWWWGMKVGILVSVVVYVVLEFQEDSAWTLVAASALDIFNTVVAAVIIIVELRIVETLTELQEERAARLGTDGGIPMAARATTAVPA